jgi:glycosyltransferase involved in cell wall biosynthesis
MINTTPPEIKCISWLSSDYSRLSVFLNSGFAQKEKVGFEKIHSGSFRLSIDLTKIAFQNRKRNVVYLIAGPCQLATIYLRLLSKKRIVIDAGWPLSDSIQESSRNTKFATRAKNNAIDFASMHMAQLTICESQEQLAHINRKFRVARKKLTIGYTGIDERNFVGPAHRPIELRTHDFGKERSLVLFRGKINPDAGIGKILDLVKLCPNLIFIICSPNFVPSEANLTNLVAINRKISTAEMHYLYSIASLAIGQFGEYPRMQRTIPHKAFEAAFFGLPYLSIDSPSLRELFPDENHALLTSEKSEIMIAKYLNEVISNNQLLKKISKNSNAHYRKWFSQERLAAERYFQIIDESQV